MSCSDGNPEDRSSGIEAQITSMSQCHFPQIHNFISSNYSRSNNMSSDKVCLKCFEFT